jgi:catechol 2,3-dioxygenase-like lactoylglutathione lyase family enzyme
MARHGSEPILPAHDMSRSRAFYESLGFTAGYHGDSYEILRRDNLVVHLELRKDLVPTTNCMSCYWRVANADLLYREFASLGLPAEGIPCLTTPHDEGWGMREFQLRDPAGNMIRVGHELTHTRSS